MGRRERDEINNTYQGKTTFVCVCHEVLLSYKFNIIKIFHLITIQFMDNKF